MTDMEDGRKVRYRIVNHDLLQEEAEALGGNSEDPHVWLDRVMKDAEVSNAELTKRLVDEGLRTANKATIGKWRTGDLLLPLHVLPRVCDALGYDAVKTERITAAAVADANPRVSHLLIDAPYKHTGQRALDAVEKLKLTKENKRLKKLLQKMIEQIETITAKTKQEIEQ